MVQISYGSQRLTGLSTQLMSRFPKKIRKLEICRAFSSIAGSTVTKDLLQRWSYFTSWYRLKKAVSLALQLQAKYRKNNDTSHRRAKICSPTSDDLRKAEIVILKTVQADAFPEEFAVLERLQKGEGDRAAQKHNKSVIKKSSTLFRLDPFTDDDGLIRVGGRLRKSQELTDELKHPVIIPKKSHITTLLIGHAHEKTAHSGRGMTLNELRNQFWVINGNSAVRSFISKCVTCRRLRSNLATQKMADLPEDRMSAAPPFTHCAVDYFGPFMVKEGRKDLKRSIYVFVQQSRAP
ncbi:uncharacterized protein LOC114575993 [Exaiptasia diaphana]|uniref:Integrase zinc-binding domain-containing protein n=1 Tax=Exaiptasia diaphana TaxID=2652724 RepID=A0A913YR79_EXADI|nr:uncharacterized protein LOC114575993 [Exaiptasia diaphana]